MKSQPQNPEFRNNPEIFHPCNTYLKSDFIYMLDGLAHMLRKSFSRDFPKPYLGPNICPFPIQK